MKYRDIRSLGKSNLVPKRHDETSSQRHERRLVTNLRHEGIVKDWCAKHGVDLKITNDAHHWTFSKNGFVAEWWPSSAKLVFQHRYTKGVHAHDYSQVLAEFCKRFKSYEASKKPPKERMPMNGNGCSKHPDEKACAACVSEMDGEEITALQQKLNKLATIANRVVHEFISQNGSDWAERLPLWRNTLKPHQQDLLDLALAVRSLSMPKGFNDGAASPAP